jgi:hypothetical protein
MINHSAHQCVEHDNVNVICLGAQIVGDKLADEILSAFLEAEFSTSLIFGDVLKSWQKLNGKQRISSLLKNKFRRKIAGLFSYSIIASFREPG